MTSTIDQTLQQFANSLPNWTLLPILTLLPNFGGFHRTLQRVRLANRGRLLLRTPGPVPFGTWICSNVEAILSWTCHVYGPFEFRTSLGTSIFLFVTKMFNISFLSCPLTIWVSFKPIENIEVLCNIALNAIHAFNIRFHVSQTRIAIILLPIFEKFQFVVFLCQKASQGTISCFWN